jgi:hypothetical protein
MQTKKNHETEREQEGLVVVVVEVERQNVCVF